MKKKAVLIYNPKSGEATFKDVLDEVIDNIQNDYDGNGDGFNVEVFRVCKYGDIQRFLKDRTDIDVVIGSGGDGTINSIMATMVENKIDVPLAIISSGTANDFASSLKLPKSPVDIVKLIHKEKFINADIGLVNDKYFINVTAVGLFANISSEVDQELKNAIGKFAYYAKGIEKSFKKIRSNNEFKVKITTSTDVYEDSFIIMTILNSTNAGGFTKLSPNSSIDDGLFEFIGFKDTTPLKGVKSFFETLKGNHIDNPNVLYFQDSYIKIEAVASEKEIVNCDIDGEVGPALPIEIKVLPGKIKVLVK